MLDEPIAELLTLMNTTGPDGEEYKTYVDYLERLNEMKTRERRTRVSPDTVAIVAGNLLGILIIVIYEQKHVLVSKGLGLIIKTDRMNS